MGNQGLKMLKRDLKKKVKILETLPPKKTKNMSFIDDYDDGKIHIICEACYNIVNKKIPLEKKKENKLKKGLMKIHKEVRQLANPKLTLKTKRKILKTSQVGSGIFTALATIVVPALLSLLAKK